MGWLGRFAAGIGRVVEQAGAAIAKLGKAVVRVVHELGQAFVDAAGRAQRAIGRALEGLAHRLQGKRSPEVERLEILAKAVQTQASAAVAAKAIDDFAAFARVKVLEAVLPRVMEGVAQVQRADQLDRDTRILIEEGQALLDGSASPAAFEALARLSESLLGRTVDQEALAHLVDFFAGAHDEVKAALRRAADDQRIARSALTAAKMMAELGIPGPESIAQIEARIADLERAIKNRKVRRDDLGEVVASGKALLSAAADPSIRLLFPEQIATIERIVYSLYRADDSATLTDTEREQLRDAVAIFLVDVSV